MYLHTQQFINEIAVDEPDPAAANALQEGLGGQFGEMRTMMQYLFQSINFRGDEASKPYKDLLQGVGTEEISHVELIGRRSRACWMALPDTPVGKPIRLTSRAPKARRR
jgi:Mn-containing catalase